METTNGIIRDFEDNVLAKASVLNKSDNKILFKIKTGEISEIKPREKIKISLYDSSNGLAAYSGEIESVSQDKISVINIASEVVVEKRFDLKVPANFNSYIIYTYTDKNKNITEEKIRVWLRDISAGGVCFSSELDFDETECFHLVFDRGSMPVIVKFRPLRKNKVESGYFIYGCAFSDIIPAQEKIIREYVFKRQLHIFTPKTF